MKQYQKHLLLSYERKKKICFQYLLKLTTQTSTNEFNQLNQYYIFEQLA